MKVRSGGSRQLRTMIWATNLIAPFGSMRLGVAYFLNSFAYLAGPPISGVLLGSQNRWVRPIIFSAVCPICSLQGRCYQGCLLPITKVVLLAGVVPVLLIARMLQAKRKGTQYV
jgi:hypothetical protein